MIRRSLLPFASLIAMSLPLSAQPLEVRTLEVRTRVGASERWVPATMVAAPGDSFDLRLKSGALTLRSTTGAMTVQHDRGIGRKRGALIGAAIGAGLIGSAVLVAGGDAIATPESWAIIGGYGVFGALLGAVLTPPRWETLSLSRSCPAYRIAAGSRLALRSEAGRQFSGRVVEHRRDSIALAADSAAEATWIPTAGMSVLLPVRDRARGALLWGAVGAAAFGALYLASPPDQRSGGLEGTFAIGQYAAIIGYLVGKQTTTHSPLPRC